MQLHELVLRLRGTATARRKSVATFIGFWLLGLLNNSPYVIMLAGANEITASAVGAVYLAAILPTLTVKLTAPYWFHLVEYRLRFWAAAALMAGSFCAVALGHNAAIQLLGVSLSGIQGGLGEASALGLCARYPSRLSITAWSSGTGFAGVAGYAWIALLHDVAGLSFKATLLLANVLVATWLIVTGALIAGAADSDLGLGGRHTYSQLPVAADDAPGAARCAAAASGVTNSAAVCDAGGPGSSSQDQPLTLELASPCSAVKVGAAELEGRRCAAVAAAAAAPRRVDDPTKTMTVTGGHCSPLPTCTVAAGSAQVVGASPPPAAAAALPGLRMGWRQRALATAALWPYMIPLFVVYFSEYAMQSGTWAAIGFPETSPEARHHFYLIANWLYQAGVFVSRSSGMLLQANRVVLWAMPALQALLLVFFALDALTHFWWNWGLLVLCFVVGLLGGGVYVNAFTLLSREVPPALREFSLAAASVADSAGIALADVAGILIQGCLFRRQHLQGAAFHCGS